MRRSMWLPDLNSNQGPADAHSVRNWVNGEVAVIVAPAKDQVIRRFHCVGKHQQEFQKLRNASRATY